MFFHPYTSVSPTDVFRSLFSVYHYKNPTMTFLSAPEDGCIKLKINYQVDIYSGRY